MSSGPYLCYREVIPASAVSCAAFFSKITQDEYLCTGCTNTINIYKIIRPLDTTAPCLSHVAHFPLNGTIRDISVVTQCNDRGVPEQYLLISCDSAKFALLQFDNINNKLRIIRMHNAEVDAIGSSAVVKADTDGRLCHPGVGDIPLTHIDHRNNIACSVLYAYQLLFLPFEVFGLPERKPFVYHVSSLGLAGPILDMCVLHDAVDTTIAILQEAEPLPIGHAAKVRNTCVITVLRVDILAGRCAVVWRKEKLPHDTLRIYPIQHHAFPHSLLIISLNAVFVANHREIRGLAMNGFAKVSVAEDIALQPCPLQTQGIELRSSRWCELPHATFLGILANGSLLMIKLLSASELVWSELRFFMDFIGRTPAACDVLTNKENNLLFMPSLLGDALLCELDLSFVSKENDVATNLFGPSLKRARRGTLLRCNGPLELTDSMTNEEITFYGAPLSTMCLQIEDLCGTVKVSMRVLDTICVMGPITNSLFSTSDFNTCRVDATSHETSTQSLYSTAASYIADREARNSLFLCAGMRASSALCRLSLGVPFSKVATRNFGDAVSVSVLNDESNMLAYIILSYQDHVRLIKASENPHLQSEQGQLLLTEVSVADTSFVNERTIMVGYIRPQLAVQVYPGGVRLLNMNEGTALQDVVADEELEMGGLGCSQGEVIVSGDCGGDFLTLLTSRKIVYVLHFEPDVGMMMVISSTVHLDMEVMCMSLYCGAFPTGAHKISLDTYDIPPEDTYFYGTESYRCVLHDPPQPQNATLLVLCNNVGQVHFFDIPSMACRYVSTAVGAMPMDLPNILGANIELPQTKKYAVAVKFCRLGRNNAPDDMMQYCLTIALNSGDVLVYYAPDRDVLNLVKLNHSVVTRRRNHKKWKKFNASDFSMYQYENTATTMRLATDIDGHTVLIISSNPPVMVSSHRGLLSLQPLCLPELPLIGNGTYIATYLSVGQLRCVAMLWREDVPATESSLRRYSSILGLYRETSGMISYPGSIAVTRRMKIGMTTHKVIELFHQKTNDKIQQALLKKKTFILSCSEEKSEKFNPKVLSAEAAEEDKSNYDRFFMKMESFHENPSNDLGAPPAIHVHCHKLQVMQNNTIVDVFELKPGEKVLDVDSVYLNIGDDKTKLFIVACTVIDDKHGEDTQGEGRLLLFTLDYALYDTSETPDTLDSTDASKPKEQSTAQSKFLESIQPKLRFLWAGPGPGSIVKQFGDKYILASVGPQLYVYRLNAETMEMDQVAFFYAQFYITSISIAKNFIMLGDVYHSVQFVVWRETDNSLTLLARDYNALACMSAEYVRDGNMLGMVVGDDEGNVKLLQYNPRVLESKQGFRLLNLADIHIGSMVTTMVPHLTLMYPRGRPHQPLHRTIFALESRLDKYSSERSSIIAGTKDGAVSLLTAVDERVYRRLNLLQQLLAGAVESVAGLNPREYRVMKTSDMCVEKRRGVLDGNLLWSYINIEESLQNELAQVMGTTADTILENLQEIDMLNSFY